MQNALVIQPGSLMFDYKNFKKRAKKKKYTWLGFIYSFGAHIAVIIIGGIIFIKPVQFAVDTAPSSMDVQLVASVPEPEPMIEEEPIIKEIIPVPEKIIEQKKPTPETKPITNPISSSLTSGAKNNLKPDYLNNPAPKYPLAARQKGYQGLVILNVSVNPAGHPTSVTLKKTSGHSILDEAAIQTVKKWSFRPASVGTLAVDSTVEVPIRFELNK